MRILVTGATGVFGRDLCGRLARKGHEVVAFARRPPATLPPGVTFAPGDVRDPAVVAGAMAGCDVVAHFAWVVAALRSDDETRDINLTGTRNVLDAMARTGCGRIVYSSSVIAYGARRDNPPLLREDDPLRPVPTYLYAVHKAEAERMIAEAGFDAVCSRTCVVLGRHTTDSIIFRFYGGAALLATTDHPMRHQFVHQEDVGRFHAEACLGGPSGPVNIAADDVLTPEEVAELLGKRLFHVSTETFGRIVRATWRLRIGEVHPEEANAVGYMPIVDTTKLREEWGFECGWTARAAVIDLARVASRQRFVSKYAVPVPWRFSWPQTESRIDADTAGLLPAAPPEMAGEFDDRVDPRWPTYTGTNLSESWPGPLTPLTLSLAQAAFRASDARIVEFLGLRGELADAVRDFQVGTFAHRLHVNVSVGREVGRHIPGSSPEQVDQQYLGTPLPDGHRPTMAPGDALRAAGLLARVSAGVAAYRHDADQLELEVGRACLDAVGLAVLTDAQLDARLALLFELCCQGWTVATVAAIVSGGAVAALERSAGPEAVASIDAADLRSAAVLRSVDRLARIVTRVGSFDAPAFTDAFERVLADIGHRGPGETELAAPTFSDRPDLLLDAVDKRVKATAASEAPGPRPAAVGRGLSRLARRSVEHRERVRDLVVRMTHGMRLAVRERARRLVEAGVLADVDDAFYLTFDELREPPLVDIAALLAARRSERGRLAAFDMPPHFTLRWQPVALDAAPLSPGEALRGIAASGGLARGPVRVLRSGDTDALQPGEVLVATVTDVGWTHLFAYAAAVVTDIGGVMSHPAVVAREFGIPSVVSTGDGSRRLRDGQLVEVDGTSGVVRVVG